MLIVISSAKTLNQKPVSLKLRSSTAMFSSEAAILVKELLKLSPDKLAKLMEINPKLTDQSIHWLSNWNENLSPKNSKPSVLMYNGEVFGLKGVYAARE
jgi:uncharacterized protein